ncbi:MAG: nickel-dependent lactate racemase [bacterium]
MRFIFKYGKKELSIRWKNKAHIKKLSAPQSSIVIHDYICAMKEAVENPINSPSLESLLKGCTPKTVSILVEDKSRQNKEYPECLNWLIEKILIWNHCQIKLVVAYGAHSKHSREENRRLYGEENLKKALLIEHDCDDKKNLTTIGILSTGNELVINKHVSQSDFIIGFGNIAPHAFAGFCGGRKIILPGVSGRESIRRNHSLICENGVGLGLLDNNPIHLEMMEAARLAELDFIINFIRNTKGDLVNICAGASDSSFFSGIKIVKEMNTVVAHGLSDVVLVSCGGHPMDKSLYHTQRTITTAVKLIKKGGTIVVFAECSEGIGNSVYKEWLSRFTLSELLAMRKEQIILGGHSAYLTARNLTHCDIILFSELSEQDTNQLHFIKLFDLSEIQRFIEVKHGKDYSAYILPCGSLILPEVVIS